ncbi:hypothetical protein TRIUR3_18854 [Triticum urartu]|uniref:Protein FMP32, mitochondrial n=1 Tax=Triticum urartu TaxID=4572 RepID=M7ZJW9_TRIUA|nr:hypothetical protein TRIUR3_18854 [Triticum urartu]
MAAVCGNWRPRGARRNAMLRSRARVGHRVGSQVRKLESQGVPTKQAEAITSAITEVLNDSYCHPPTEWPLFVGIGAPEVRKLESQGVPTKQAEAITSAITEVLNDSLESISESFVSKAEMQKSEMLQEANISKFKSQVQSSQENHFSLLQRETEKLRGDIDKMRSELKYEIDKVTAGQRLDLNLERGRIRDELAKQNEETTDLTTKLDKEIHSLKAQLEAAKYDVIKYCIGTIVSISAVGLAVLRIVM